MNILAIECNFEFERKERNEYKTIQIHCTYIDNLNKNYNKKTENNSNNITL